MKHVVVIRLLVESGDASKIESAVRQTAEGAARNIRVFGFKVVGFEHGFGIPNKEENIRLSPKRMHYGYNGFTACDRDVAKNWTTEIWNKVTCKICRRKRPQLDSQKELFP